MVIVPVGDATAVQSTPAVIVTLWACATGSGVAINLTTLLTGAALAPVATIDKIATPAILNCPLSPLRKPICTMFRMFSRFFAGLFA